MRAISDLLFRLRALLRPTTMERELDDEIERMRTFLKPWVPSARVNESTTSCRRERIALSS